MKKLLLSAMLLLSVICGANAQMRTIYYNDRELGLTVGAFYPLRFQNINPGDNCSLQLKGLNLQPMVGLTYNMNLELNNDMILDRITTVAYTCPTFSADATVSKNGQSTTVSITNKTHTIMLMERVYLNYPISDQFRIGVGGGIGMEDMLSSSYTINGNSTKVGTDFTCLLLLQVGAKLRYCFTDSFFLDWELGWGWNVDIFGNFMDEPTTVKFGDYGTIAYSKNYINSCLGVGWVF